MQLWKTCRAVNNEIRLAMLREIARSPNRELNVLQAGDFVGLKKAAASQYLKQLAEAGFLTVERTGKFVVCSGKPQDGTAASRIAKALEAAFPAIPHREGAGGGVPGQGPSRLADGAPRGDQRLRAPCPVAHRACRGGGGACRVRGPCQGHRPAARHPPTTAGRLDRSGRRCRRGGWRWAARLRTGQIRRSARPYPARPCTG